MAWSIFATAAGACRDVVYLIAVAVVGGILWASSGRGRRIIGRALRGHGGGSSSSSSSDSHSHSHSYLKAPDAGQRHATIRFMTHNIRYAATTLAPGETRWERRLPLLVAHFGYHSSYAADTVICMQEVLHRQLVDLKAGLNGTGRSSSDADGEKDADAEDVQQEDGSAMQEWQVVGCGRDDGHRRGEYAPIWFRPRAWELQHWETVWLSPEPMRRGWDAASVRVVTVAVLHHRSTGMQVVVFNTHLDVQGVVARRRGAEMLVSLVRRWAGAGAGRGRGRDRDGAGTGAARKIVLAGDLNSERDGEAYRILRRALADCSEECAAGSRYGEYFTYTGFDACEEPQRLDYIFVGQGSAGGRCAGCAVLPNRFEVAGGSGSRGGDDDDDSIYHSDHRAVVADVAFSDVAC